MQKIIAFLLNKLNQSNRYAVRFKDWIGSKVVCEISTLDKFKIPDAVEKLLLEHVYNNYNYGSEADIRRLNWLINTESTISYDAYREFIKSAKKLANRAMPNY